MESTETPTSSSTMPGGNSTPPTEGQSRSNWSQPQSENTAQQTSSNTAQQDPEFSEYGYEESSFIPGMVKPQKEEILFEWQAPSRPFKKHNRQFYSTIGIMGLLIALILFFAGQVLTVAVVLAVVFLSYVMYSTPPGKVTHKFTTYGIRVEEELYYWEEMGRFWYTTKYGQTLVNIEVSRFPNRLTLLLGDINPDDFKGVISEILLNETPPPTTYEKAATWLHKKVPIDLES